MRLSSVIRYLAAPALLASVALAALSTATPAAEAPPPNNFRNGQAGFVVNHIAYALAQDASVTGACPNGMTQGYANWGDAFLNAPTLARTDGEAEQAYLRRIFTAGMADPNVKNACMNPELAQPDPRWRSVPDSANVQVEGIDLDGQNSRAGGHAAPGTCSHADFRGTNGASGVDNQFFRAVGCNNSFQSTGQSNTWEIEMYTGSWGILVTLSGVDNMQNDPDIQVGFYSNNDPMELSPTREALPDATYAIEQNPRYQAVAHGRIVNGVITTDPVTMRFHWIVNSIREDRELDDARARLTFTPTGGLQGYLAGYVPVESLYNVQFGFRDGTDGSGNLAPLRLRTVSSIGYAFTQHHSCNGAYYALKAVADGHRDPRTGECSAVSTQFKISAIPAFVVNNATSSANSNLDHAPSTQY